jgi:deoxyinosine 3'endonuclease (endonuclease V)
MQNKTGRNLAGSIKKPQERRLELEESINALTNMHGFDISYKSRVQAKCFVAVYRNLTG